MANTLGTINIGNIGEYSFDDGHVSISGYVTSKASLNTVEELFTKAQGNTRVERVLGGYWKGIDMTVSYVNWKKGAFDADQLYDGWHLLLSFRYHPPNYMDHYPYVMDLHWFKTTDVTAESVGTGDGSTKIFYLDYPPVTPTSETIKLDGTPTSAYTIDYDQGKITFDTAPGVGVAITADYAYFT